ncbi:hypothetical protein [Amycolatopsis sp. NPDC051128]|uniref:hypothetical protein n=1 Tax=Amycolatopsis sp. NPDC051128 TaxID=3155412 RepID=UPI00344716C7
MSELAKMPGVIPYVDHHDGPRRLLTIEIPHLGHTVRAYAPIASVDGRQYVVSWGSVSFEVPADRNVHVSVHLQTNGGRDYTISPFASVVLSPHLAPMRLLTQFTPSQGPEGTLIPVG